MLLFEGNLKLFHQFFNLLKAMLPDQTFLKLFTTPSARRLVSGGRKNAKWPLKRFYPRWLIMFVLFSTHAVQAQMEQTSAPEALNTNANQGSWRLKTDATTRRTQIQFFGVDQQLLYEETLPEKLVKLSRRNQMELDQLLAELLTNQLLTTRLKTKVLPPTPIKPSLSRGSVKVHSNPNTTSNEVPCQVRAYINRAGKLHVLVDNPNRWRYTIKIFDSWNRLLHEEFSNHNQYHHALDLSGLARDSYQILIRLTNKPDLYTYKLRIGGSNSTYSLEPWLKDTLKSKDQSNTNL